MVRVSSRTSTEKRATFPGNVWFSDGTMTLTGSVAEKGSLTDDGLYGALTVSIRGANDVGDHVTGSVTVLLPAAPAPAPA